MKFIVTAKAHGNIFFIGGFLTKLAADRFIAASKVEFKYVTNWKVVEVTGVREFPRLLRLANKPVTLTRKDVKV